MPVDPPEPEPEPEPNPSIPRLPGPPIVHDWRVYAGIAAALAGVLVFALVSINHEMVLAWRRIDAGAVELSGSKIKGPFWMESTFPTSGIISSETGGACLFADLTRFNVPANAPRPCQNHSQCAIQDGSGWDGFCDVDGTKICWVRPGGNEFCNKKPFEPRKIGEIYHTFPDGTAPFDLSTPHYMVNGQLLPFTERFSTRGSPPNQRKIDWRVLTCLNSKFDITNTSATPPCADGVEGNELRVWGPITPLDNP